ncbi:TolC family protein [Parvularcula flava]|uniref:TolC family protein n=1 Tax=Aquisalinus luteolus TaxID=1566827 RepID=A0ABX0HRC6_9PROT|nr:TolC family protein [Aquisalinus luteolus]NHK29693.1 TolC family protein [Aquisalinus luteolus]
MKRHIWGGLCALGILAMPIQAYAAASCGGTYQPRLTSAQAGMIEENEPLTLDQVLTQIRHASPEVRAAALETKARAAEARQAGRWLNPSLSLEVENFGGDGAFDGFDQSDRTYAISQTLQLGGKRQKQVRAARALEALGSAQCETILREAELEAALSFYDLHATIQLAEMADSAADLAARFRDTVIKRYEAGAAAPPDVSRAKTEAARLQAAAADLQAQIIVEKLALAALWGADTARFGNPIITATQAAPSQGEVSSHPAIVAAAASLEASRAQEQLERVRIIPDITVSAGVREFEATGESALVAGLEVPLPLFDRNRDAADAAAFRAQASAIDAEATEARLRARLQSSIAQQQAARRQLDLLQSSALPEAQSAHDAAIRGYQAGKFDLTATLDARQALIDTQIAVIESNRKLNAENVLLQSLIGAAPFSEGDMQ